MIAGRSQGEKVHWFYRVDGEFKKVEFTHKPTKLKVIEILGDGQQVVVGPSIHPSGDTYDNLEGNPNDIEADQLVDACRLLFHAVCDRLGLDPFDGVTIQQQATQRTPATSDGTRPGDDYNERGDVRELLQKHGWESSHESGEREYWTRPDKQHGVSASLTEGKVFIAQSPNQPIAQSPNQPIAQSTNQPINQSTKSTRSHNTKPTTRSITAVVADYQDRLLGRLRRPSHARRAGPRNRR